ncbi:hypothetical protein LTR94_024275 [Friedmanniomyces endolithicus]|nr:hypothetical protein LTR94_024275 [Friedmanniomyces endolithicus]
MIALHGVWSWISSTNRSVIVKLIRERLAPGGVVYVSYNCQPGWSSVAPVRHLLSLGQHLDAGGLSRDATETDRALAFLEEVLAVNPRYFAENKIAISQASNLRSQSRAYLAHEYLNEDWHTPYFSEVASSLAEAKLSFVASARLLDRVNDINIGRQAIAYVESIKDIEKRESIRDFLVNQRFRTDLFIKGPVRMTIAELEAFWDDQAFVLGCPLSEIDLKISGPLGEADLPEPIYRPLVLALASQDYSPKTLAELHPHPGLRSIPRMDLISALTVLVGMDVLRPSVNPTGAAIGRSRAYNDYVLERALTGPHLNHLASAVIAGGIPCVRPAQLLLRSWFNGARTSSELAQGVWRVFETSGERAIKNDREVAGADENIQVLTEMAERFLKDTLPVYRALRVVD